MIEWLIQRAADDPQVAIGVPPEGLLSAPETIVYNNLYSAKRRKDWLLGRWTAKRVVQAAAEKSGGRRLSCSEISILAAKDGAPEVWLGEDGGLSRGDYNISISHSSDVSLCAVLAPGARLLGADIEAVEPRSSRFVEDYFTEEEIEAVSQAPLESRDCLITAIWSGKESALKAVREGLRLDTRSVSCRFTHSGTSTHPGTGGYKQESVNWSPFTVQWLNKHEDMSFPQLVGWHRIWRDFVLTLVVTGEPQHSHSSGGIWERH